MKPDSLLPMAIFPNVKREMAQIPEDLWDIFWCDTPEKWWQYELNIINRKKKQLLRHQRWTIVKKYGLPIRFCRESLNYILTYLRIQQKRQDLQNEWREKDEK